MRFEQQPLFYIDVYDFDIFIGLVRLVCLDVFDCMDDFQAGYNTPEDGVLFIEPGRCSRSDEELRTIRTRAGIRHADSVRS